MQERGAHARVWQGRVRPQGRAAHEQLVAWLNGEEARRLLARYPLQEYRLEERGDELRITMVATDPAGLVRFLRWDRVWPDFWEYQGGGRAAEPLPDPDSLGPALRVHWRRADVGGDDSSR